jgi:hypothetical protein
MTIRQHLMVGLCSRYVRASDTSWLTLQVRMMLADPLHLSSLFAIIPAALVGISTQ